MSEVLKTDTLGSHKRLICMVGLPYSGKSTIARRLGYPIVNPDSIRIAIHGHKFIPEAEPLVWATAKIMVRALFLSGHDIVVLDTTNTTDDRRAEWSSMDWATEFHLISTGVELCCLRAKEAGDHVMINIIDKMNAKLTMPEDLVTYRGEVCSD